MLGTRTVLLFAGVGFTLACEDQKELTAPEAAAVGAGVQADAAGGTIPLPIDQSVTSDAAAFEITQLGLGQSGVFRINKATNTSAALLARTNGKGFGVRAVSAGSSGSAGLFETLNESNDDATLAVQSNSVRAASFRASALHGVGAIAEARRGMGLWAIGSMTNTGGPAYGLSATGYVAIRADGGPGDGWAATFFNTAAGGGNGVLIQTNPGKAGLQVIGGTKNAVVATPSGARALYTEESSEVWFTDYGFGRLEQGRARILIDPDFAQTINPAEPYHVFLEAYGDARLYVAERTPLGFVVRGHAGDPDVEFSYRLVARRLGYETTRLERAPWADGSPPPMVTR